MAVSVYLFSVLCPQQEISAFPLDIQYVVFPLTVFSKTIYYVFLNKIDLR